MKKSTRLALLLLSASCGSLAHAQSSYNVAWPSVRSPIDSNGVNLATGWPQIKAAPLSIGTGSAGLSLDQTWVRNGWRHKYVIQLSLGAGYADVLRGGEMYAFASNQNSYVSSEGNGSTLSIVNGSYVFQDADGTKIIFSSAPGGYYYTTDTSILPATEIDYPNGEKVFLSYDTQTYQNGPNTTVSLTHLVSVRSSRGYVLTFSYPFGPVAAQNYSAVTAGNTACVGSCTVPQGQPAESFASTTSGSNQILAVTDALGRITRYTTNAASQLIAIRTPGRSSDNITFAYDTSGRVQQVVKDGVTWTYAWSQSGNILTGTRTDASGHTHVTTVDLSTAALLTEKDEANQTTTYSEDPQGRWTKVTYPEGNSTEYQYDANGNVVQTTLHAKPSAPAPDIISTAGYPTSCNSVIACRNPIWTKDANNNQTDYGYDATTGLVTSVTGPAVNGVRPESRFHYEQRTPFVNNGSGGLVASSPISVLTQTSTCRTGSAPACLNSADERRTTVNYGDQSGATGNNILPLSTTIAAGNGDPSVTTTSSVAYDLVGNITTMTDPLGNQQRLIYDADRELIGTISADPDGAGSLKNRAQRLSYNGDGLIYRTEIGTTNGQSDTAWSAFSALQQTDVQFDGNGRPSRATVSAGGTTYNLTEVSYDALGRSLCSAVRMKSSAFGATLEACSLTSPAGSDGPDRITRTTYDPDGRPQSVTEAYGTGASATTNYTYTANGQVQTIADPKGNLTTYTYDGFDRSLQTRYPNPSGGGSSSSDYEQLGYDGNGNVTSRRLRNNSSISYGYDALNRLTFELLPSGTGNANPSFSYDLLGNMVSANNANATFSTGNSFTYDALSRMTSETSTYNGAGAVTKTMQYDAAGRRTRFAWPDLYLTYDYDNLNEMTGIHENGGTLVAGFSYDDLGRRSSRTAANGTGASYGYDPISRLTALNITGATNPTNIGITGYNPANQISGRTNSNDAYAWTAGANGAAGYSVDGRNLYTQIGANVVQPDLKGNVAKVGASSYTFGAENTLTTGGGSSFWHDALEHTAYVTGTNQRFDYDGDQLIAIYNSSNVLVRRFVFGPGVDEPLVWYEGSGTADRRQFDADERGSVVRVTNAAGSVLRVNTYDEYGIPSSTNLGRFGFTGQVYLPEIGMYDYKARIYNPAIGSFMQPDPIGQAGGANIYSYVHADPLNLSDPSGTDCWDHWKFLQDNKGEAIAGSLEYIGATGGCVSDYLREVFSGFRGSFTNWATGSGSNTSQPAPPAARKARDITRTIPPCMRAFLASQGYGAPNLSRVTFHYGDGGRLIAKGAFAHGNPAVTINNDIYVKPGHWNEYVPGTPDFFEETLHTIQWAESGQANFGLAWALGTAMGALATGDPHNSPLEAQAMGLSQDLAKAYANSKTCRKN